MLRFLLDTDHLTLLELQHPQVLRRYIALPPGEVGPSAVSVEEALRGRLGKLSRQLTGKTRVDAYARLVETVRFVNGFPIVAFDPACENRFQALRTQSLRVGMPDLKIAAVALVNNLTLLTRNRRDFSRIPGLSLDDWSV